MEVKGNGEGRRKATTRSRYLRKSVGASTTSSALGRQSDSKYRRFIGPCRGHQFGTFIQPARRSGDKETVRRCTENLMFGYSGNVKCKTRRKEHSSYSLVYVRAIERTCGR